MTKLSGSHQHIAPAPDRPFLDEENRLTLDALFSHPLPYMGWNRVMALFKVLGTVGPRADHRFEFRIGGEHHLVCKPANEDLSAAEAINLRHLVERAGLAPDPALPATHASPAPRDLPAVPGLLVVMDHHGAKVFQVDATATDPARHTIKPYDPYGYLHHLAHKDESRERGQRAAEDPSYYERLAETVLAGTAEGDAHVVVAGDGHGHSSAAHHFVEYLRSHHRETYGRTVTEVVADLSSLTDPQLLDLGRRTLSRQPA
jgi:hypothetical protein